MIGDGRDQQYDRLSSLAGQPDVTDKPVINRVQLLARSIGDLSASVCPTAHVKYVITLPTIEMSYLFKKVMICVRNKLTPQYRKSA